MYTVKIYLDDTRHLNDVPDVLKENIEDLDYAKRIAISAVEGRHGRMAYIEDGNDITLRYYKGLTDGYICRLRL